MANSSSENNLAPIYITPFRKVIIFVLTPILRLLAKIQINNTENIPIEGAAILASNHLSFFDGFVLQYAVKRPVFFMGKAEVFRNPFLRLFMFKIGAFPVERGSFDRGAIRHARKVLQAGQLLGMFPEEHRTYGYGMIAAKSGTAHLAMKLNCPIIPVAMDGTHYIFKHPFKRANVTVKFLTPIYPEQKITAQNLTDALMREIASQLPNRLRGYYG